jgi:hypothetical protein
MEKFRKYQAEHIIPTYLKVIPMSDDVNVEEERMNKDVDGNEYTFRTPSDWGTITGSFIISDGEKVLVCHHAADEDEEEWTEVRNE